MKLIGLTGSFGTGKTFVASIFGSLGGQVLDADEIAHDVIKRGRAAYKRIVRAFGKGILEKGGNIDRRRLADMVFANESRLKRLNRIVHPEVVKAIKNGALNIKEGIVVVDAPLLIEAKLVSMVDYLVVVKSSRENQIKRCMKKFHIRKEDVLDRIGHQIPIGRKIRLADFVVDNDGTRSDTRRQVKKIWRRIYGDS